MSCGRGSSDGGTGRTSLAVAPSHADDDILKNNSTKSGHWQNFILFALFKTLSALEAIEIHYLFILEQTWKTELVVRPIVHGVLAKTQVKQNFKYQDGEAASNDISSL